MNNKKLISILAALLFSCNAWANDVVLNNDHPGRYVVQKGDTLWGVAAKFMRDPWRWKDLWRANPQLSKFGNPNLIYPGDVLHLAYDSDGNPYLSKSKQGAWTNQQAMNRDNGKRGGLIKLSPTVRTSELSKAIPTIPLDAIRQFLVTPSVLDKDSLDEAPYIIAHKGERIISGPDDVIYVRNFKGKPNIRYSIFRKGETYYDPDLGTGWMCQYRTSDSLILGYGIQHVGVAKLITAGDPAIMKVMESNREVLSGDRIVIVPETIAQNFYPTVSEKSITGRIVDVHDAVLQVGEFQVVVIGRGQREGVEVGHVFVVDRAGETIVDHIKPRKGWQLQPETVTLPDEEIGTIMVFAVFERVSYALVMRSHGAIHKLDKFHNP